MMSFYLQVIEDDMLAHFFTNELGDDINNEDWTEHIELLTEFWLAKLLGEKTYEGNVFGMHTRVQHINRASFVRWMELFTVCLDEVYVPEVSAMFRNKAADFSKQFIDFLKI
jgi:hemoglobin